MKKSIIAWGLVLGLLGATLSQGWAQGLLPWHIDTYTVASTTGAFTDISTNPNAVALGADMTPLTDLRNTTFARTGNPNDGFSDDVTVNAVASLKEDPVVAGFPLDFEFNFFGFKMTHFTVSAYGGVFFRDTNMQPAYTSSLASSGRWGVWAHPYVSKTETTAPVMATADLVVSPSTGAPAYYLIAGEEGKHVLTVQHHYLVRGTATGNTDEWTFQFKFYEETGKIEFIAKEFEYANALSGRHRIAIVLTDFGGSYPTYDYNGDDFVPADPYKEAALRLQSQNNHKMFVGQTDAMSAAKGWDTLAYYYSASENATMRIDADHHPEPGHTIVITPQKAPETKDLEPFTADHYTIIDESATATTYDAKIYYNYPMFTAQSLHEAGSIVAIISESETPDYTLENGVYYTAGHTFEMSSGFQPKVLANQSSKATMNWVGDKVTKPSRNFEVGLNATGLEKAHVYYIHLYRMFYAGTNAPTYSTLCHTITFTTDFAEPKQFTQVGLSDIDKVRLKVEPADNLGVLVIKSKDLDVKPTGQLKKGDKIGDAEVLELLTDEKEWDLPLEYGEGCFIVAFSVNMTDPDHYIYAPTKKYFSVGTAYKELPGLVDFSGCAYGVPNFEYNGINMMTQDYGQRLAPKIARDLPFGYTRTPYTDGTLQRVFGLGKPGSRTPVTVYAYVVPDVDFITPPIVANKNRILATFNADWVSFDDFGGTYDSYSFASSSNSNDICSIEYSIDGGEWQPGITYKGYDEVFNTRDDNGYYNVSYALIADEDAGESYIGKKIRFRFISKTTMTGSMGAAMYLVIPSIDVKEDKICKTPSNIEIIDAQTTANDIALAWVDNNYQNGVKFNIAYKLDDNAVENWSPKKSDDTSCVVGSLLPFTKYAFQVSADCGPEYGTSYASNTVRFSTIHTFPYKETMAEDTGYFKLVGGTNAYYRGEDPFARGVKVATGTLPNTGYADLSVLADYGAGSFNLFQGWDKLVTNRRCPQSFAVRESTTANAWLLTAPVFVKEHGKNYPQVVRFKANSANQTASTAWAKGSLGDSYTRAKLYVLVSYNGKFSMNDTIGVIAVGTETIEDRTFEFEVPGTMTQEGRMQAAFCFVNPDANTSDANTNLMLFEIYDVELAYAQSVCIPLGDLTRTQTTTDGATFEWEGYSDHYKFYWGTSDDNYTDVATTTETTYTLTGLQDGTRYYVKVEGFCDAEETEVAPNTQTDWFRTFEACHVPADFTVTDITTGSATFSSTNEQDIMTQRLIYLTPEDGETRIIVQPNDKDTLVVDDLLDNMAYVARTQSVCGTDNSELSEPITFKTLVVTYNIKLNIQPDEEAGTVEGEGRYEKGKNVTITATPAPSYIFVAWKTEDGETVSEDATYTFEATADVTYTALFQDDPEAVTYTVTLNVLPDETAGKVVGAGPWKEGRNVAIIATPNEGYTFVAWLNGTDTLSKETTYIFKATADVTYTALFARENTANEEAVKAAFNVSAANGQLYVRNLQGLTVEEVTVYGLTGRKLGYFTPNSREDLVLPINAERAILLVRLASEHGVAIYKVYLH